MMSLRASYNNCSTVFFFAIPIIWIIFNIYYTGVLDFNCLGKTHLVSVIPKRLNHLLFSLLYFFKI